MMDNILSTKQKYEMGRNEKEHIQLNFKEWEHTITFIILLLVNIYSKISSTITTFIPSKMYCDYSMAKF